MSEIDLITVKELASELEITDLVLKKLIKFFEIPNQKVKRNIHLSDEAVEQIKKVMLLKAEGKRNKDIKQFFDDERKKEKKALEKKLNPSAIESSESELESTETTENVEIVLDIPPSEKLLAPVAVGLAETTSVLEPLLEDTVKAEAEPSKRKEDDEVIKAKKEPAYIQDFIESEEIEAKLSSIKQEDFQAEALALDAEAEEAGKPLEEVEALEETEEVIKDSLSPRKIRRKAFSFRYIQREIANDTKALNAIKNKLKKAKLSHLERLNLLDSLDRRAKMLNSWIQILRWVKS